MEINITQYFESAEHSLISGSQFELGDNAAKITWNNALEAAKESSLLDTEEKLQAMRDYAHSSGGWSLEEIASWDAAELNALFNQFVSGNIREIENLCSEDNGDIDWEKYSTEADKGRISGAIYRGDDGQIYYYLGI